MDFKNKEGVKIEVAENNNTRWTEEEIEFLKLNYNNMKPKNIAEVLGRTIVSVKSQAYTLGFARKKPKIIDGKKPCSKCNQVREIDKFYKHNSSKDGYYAWCVDCVAVNRREKYFRKNIQKELDKKQAWIDSKKDQLYKCSKCKEEFKIEAFNVFKRKDGSYERKNLCTPCNSKRDRERVLKKERENKYAEPNA